MAFTVLFLQILDTFLILKTVIGAWPMLQAGPQTELFRPHFMWGFVTIILTLFIHCLVMFYFIGTGGDLKEGSRVLPDHDEIAKRTRKFKAKVFPFATFSMVLMIAGPVFGSAWAFAGMGGRFTHLSIMVVAVTLNFVAFPIEFKAMRANTKLMREVDLALKKREAAQA